ncbi:MAG: proprotein convertase P-domain-containing protein [Erythrobacter sp.]
MMRWHFLRAWAALLVATFMAALMPSAAQAQTVYNFVNTTDSSTGGINENSTPCTNRFTRTFNVTNSFTIADVDIGVLMAHTYRGDLQMWLVSPTGTRIQLTAGSGSNGASNFNALFDDSASSSITTYTANSTATSTTSVPPFANSYRPTSALSGFNGQNSAGTWTLEICDQYNGDSGTFYQANLTLTSVPTNYADLSLAKSVSNASPANGATISYTLTVANSASSPSSASGVVVTDLLPAGVIYSSHSGSGTYNSSTGQWSVGSLAPGASSSLTITVTVNASAGATITNTAEVTSSSIADLDSTPDNGVTSEDDYASRSFTVSGSTGAGTPPTLVCTSGSVLQDWDTLTWSAGTTSNSYNIASIGSIAFGVANTASPDATISGAPTTNQSQTGGYTAANSVYFAYDFANRTDYATITMTLPTAVPGAQFQIYDVDLGSWADHIVVTGTYGGTTVYPTLTNGAANYVAGNEAFGSAGSGATSSDGNITVTFQSPVDTIIITYGNHSAASSNPGGQVISLADITWCKPYANLAVTKISSVLSDPVNGTTNPKAIPGALIDYLITVSNSGVSATNAGSVVISDAGPANAKLCFDANGTGTPVAFTDGSPTSGVTYNYVALGNTGDGLEFSNDGGTSWTYTPTADAEGCDAAITNFRVTTGGQFKPSSSFTLRTRYRIN